MSGEHTYSSYALDVHVASGRKDAAIEAHVAECAQCRAYVAHLDALAGALPAWRAPVPDRAAPRSRWARRFAPAAVAGALALAATVAFIVGRPRDDGAYVGVKGTPGVQVLVRRAGATRIWDGRSPVRAGDAVAFRAACEGLAHASVASRDASGAWTRVADSACPDASDALPFTLVFDDDPRDERVAVVLSARPLDDDALTRAAQEEARSAATWTVSFVFHKDRGP